MPKYAPVVVFVYNRPTHTQKMLKALNENHLSEQTDLIIYCDGPKDEAAVDKVEAVRDIVDTFSCKSNFKNLQIKKSNTNNGLAESVKMGVSEIVSKYGRIIVLEDDLLTSRFFLEYMNNALDHYENNERIWSISGYSFKMKALEQYPHDVYISERACSWGWATWDNRWSTVDWSVADYDKFRFNFKDRWLFSRWGMDLPVMLDEQIIKGFNSWAIIWCYQAFKDGKVTVYPKNSLIKNIGLDGSGDHKSVALEKYDVTLDEKNALRTLLNNIIIDETIRKEFKKRYSNGWYKDVKMLIRSLFIRFLIL